MALAPHPTSADAPDIERVPATGTRGLLRRLAIRCPTTGLSTDTGFDLTALPQLIGEQLLIDCLECGQDHAWRVEDAFLD